MGNRGYSLLEVMISMLVLAIAFLAIVATQLGTLNGYVSARDGLQSAEMARRTAELLRLQGSQWIYNIGDDGTDPTKFSFDPEDLYDNSSPMPFDTADPIGDLIGNSANNGWLALVNSPVDERFNRSTINPNQVGKYCIYARAAEIQASEAEAASGPVPVMAGIRVQIAVVYPGPNATLTDCTIDATVTEAMLSDVGDRTAADPSPPMELAGLRGSYAGTVVMRRAHLTNEAALGSM